MSKTSRTKNKPDNIQDTRLITLLKALSPTEFKTLEKFLQSPYCNTSKNSLKLYEWLKPYYPKFNHPKLEKTHIHQHLRPHKKYQRKYVTDRASDLYQLVEKFLILEQVQQNERLQKIHLLKAYQQRRLSNYFFTKSDELTEQIEGQTQKSWQDFYDLWQLYEDRYTYFETDKFQIGKKDFAPKMIENFEITVLINALKQACTKLSRENILNINHKNEMLFQYLQQAESYKNESPVLHIYQKCAELWQVFSDEGYEETWTLFLQLYPQIPSTERPNIMVQFLNFCSRRMRLGKLEYIPICFTAMEFATAERLMVFDDKMSSLTFLNVALISALHHQFSWTERFIATNQHFLPEADKEKIVKLAQVFLHFYQKDFKTVTDLIIDSDAKDVLTARLKSYELMAFYELGSSPIDYISLLQSKIKAMKVWLKRNEVISSEWQTCYLNFTSFLHKILQAKLSLKKKKDSQPNLKEQVHNLSLIVHKRWLIEKVEEL